MQEPLPERPPAGTVAGRHGGLLAAQALQRRGVDTIFAVCGGHVLPLLDGCLEVGIRVIDTRHESTAALAAEGWALATGRVGVAAVTAGAGFANALVGLLDAGVWSLPFMLFSGRTGLAQQGWGAVMDVDQRAVATPVAKHALTCVDTNRIPHAVAEALYHARAGRPGAVYVEVPYDVLSASGAPELGHLPAGFPPEPPLPAGAAHDVERAFQALEGAERPLLLAGGGAFWSGAGAELVRLAETAGIPLTTTSAARGLVADSHRWCLGSLVHAGAALLSADVVVVLGSAFNANLAYGRPPLLSAEQTVVQVDIRPEGLGGSRLPDIAVAGDIRHVANALADDWRKGPEGRLAWLEQAQQLTGAMRASWDRQIDDHSGSLLHAGAVARELVLFARETFGDGVTFVVDGGDSLSWGIAYAYAERPGRLLSTTTALGTLGVGLPFALAAKAARPDEPVLLFIGDGAFGLSAMELDSAVRHGLPVVCVVSNNAAWGDVAHEQDMRYGVGRRIATELTPTRYDRFAEALGGHGEHVTRLDELRPALRRALDSGLPAVVNVETDPAVLSELLRNIGQLGLM